MVFDLTLKSARTLVYIVRIGRGLRDLRQGYSRTRVRRRWGNWLRVEARDYRFRVERDKVSYSKAYSYVVFRNRGVERLNKCVEEVLLYNVGNLHPYYLLDLLTIQSFKWTKIPDIERLEEVRRI